SPGGVIKIVLPIANGPSSSIRSTPAFHAGQPATSAQSAQTSSADAVVSTVCSFAHVTGPRVFVRLPRVADGPTIVGLGGVSWDDEERRRLEDYWLALTGAERPKVLVVPTAAGEDAELTLMLFGQLADRAELTHLSFFPWPPGDLHELALRQDAIYVT